MTHLWFTSTPGALSSCTSTDSSPLCTARWSALLLLLLLPLLLPLLLLLLVEVIQE
jgi:hypothetical protein